MNLDIQNNMIKTLNNVGFRLELSEDFKVLKKNSIKESFLLHLYIQDWDDYSDKIYNLMEEYFNRNNFTIIEFECLNDTLFEFNIKKIKRN